MAKSDLIDFKIFVGHWEFPFKMPDNAFGFIYEITNLINNRKYIGKKQMLTTKKLPPLKGKKNKRHKTVETDWKTYTGSSNELNADIEKYGKDNFKFEILKFCDNKSQLAYFEIKKQIEEDVLLKEEYYNGIINCRLNKVKNK
jgi:hypothetical protein